MKKLLLALFLAAAVCVTPAVAVEADFTDVPAGSWYEQGVGTCAGKGVMVGTGEGTFSPDTVLTRAECLTLAYRLYDLQHGGEGSFLKAPEDWGKLTYTLADGTVFEGYVVQSEVGPDRWWRDVCYTISQKGLAGVVEPGDFSDFPAERDFFTKTLAAVTGELEVINEVETFPDANELNDETRQAALKLYRAGVLTGVDDQGTFDRGGSLTRAQAAVMAARVLDPNQRVKPINFDTAFAALQNAEGFRLETVKDGGEGPATALLRSKPCEYEGCGDTDFELYLVYKHGSALGNGTVKRLLLPSTVYLKDYNYAPTDRAPDSMEFNEDGSKLIYTYRFAEALSGGNTPLHDKGTYVYTVDVETGELRVALMDSYEYAMKEVFAAYQFQLDRQIEKDLCSIVLGTYLPSHIRRACIVLVYKEGSQPGAGTKIWLPTKGGTTRYDSTLPHALSVNEDDRTLTYSYRFEEPVYSWDGRLAQKAGSFTCTVDLLSGEYEEVYTADQSSQP